MIDFSAITRICPPFGSATAAAAALRAGHVSSVELTQYLLARIEAFNPKLNALITLLPEQALRAAQQADAQRARGIETGPLHGVPITIKDIYAVADARTTEGVPAQRDNISAHDAVAVARLRDAGAIILGLTNVPPLSADWITHNELFGQTNNPWDATRTPGGSSGGCAAAVAAGLSYLSLGSDIAGSIRIPAHFCGVFGHKASVGVIPLSGAFPSAQNAAPAIDNVLGVAGLLARSADDLALALQVVGGPDGAAAQAYRWQLPAPRARNLADYRIGFVLDDEACPLTAPVKAALVEAVRALRNAGVKLQEGWPPGLDPALQLRTYDILLNTHLSSDLDLQSTAALRELRAAQPGGYTAAKARLFLSPTKYHLAALRQRTALRAIWQRYFENFDAFLLPAAFTPAVAHDANLRGIIATAEGERAYGELLYWNAAATLSGHPATVAPLGLVEGQLPVGIQVMGPVLEDATSIDIAGRITTLMGGLRNPPGFAA